MEATKELEMMKDGARRVQEFLEAKGIEVKHSLMLEALSAGFGSRNWRTVREKLNAPTVPKPTLESLDGLRWHIFAVYCDNDQPYNGYYAGATAHEAQVFAQIERLFDEDGSEIDVNYVMDRLSGPGKEAETYCFDSEEYGCNKHSVALRAVAQYAEKCLGDFQGRGVADAEAWDLKSAHIEVFVEMKSSGCCELLDEISAFTKKEHGFNGDHSFTWVDFRGVEYEGVTASDALETILDIIEPLGVEHLSEEMKTNVYHAQALLKYASRELDYVMGYQI
jgi:hypothetical protein